MVIILSSFYRLTKASPHSPFAPSIPFSVDEWANQTEAWCHTKECHMGRSLFFNDLHGYLCNCVTFYDSYKCSPVSSGQAGAVFERMAGDFMKPVVNIVDQLLAAGVNVTIYNGQLDLIVDTMGEDVNHYETFQNGNSGPTHFRL